MTTLTVHLRTELQKRILGIRAELPHAIRGAAALLEIGRMLYEIRSLRLYIDYGSLDELCREEFGFTGSRGSQLADWYAIRRTILASKPDGERGRDSITFDEFFSESHARAIKHLSPAQQVEAWEKATEETEKPTARILARIAAQFNVPPEEIEAMTREEQQRLFGDIDAAIREAKAVEFAADTARLAVKRNRRVLADLRAEGMERYFGEGEYHVKGGLAGLVELVTRECERVAEELATPLMKD